MAQIDLKSGAFQGSIVPATLTADRTYTLPDADATLGDNTPAWHVGIDAAQALADATTTKVQLDDVKFDTGFTWDTTNFRGIPGTAGKYLIGCFFDSDSSTAIGGAYVYLYVNGSSVAWWGYTDTSDTHTISGTGGSTIVTLGATDYVEMFAFMNNSSGTSSIRRYDSTQCITYMYGMQVIGA